ncbi:hypothetical protein [Flavobacterium sp. W22_SRS_FP1]|uniref:hypothetical protein n=1 Tax=Flavobacterium sp. W22_SRS_FP1 TaxID=3240276 RepID=UPI003F935C9C
MKTSDKTMVLFYQQIGKVFYSIAAVDKTVRPEEVKELKKVLQKEWLPLENSVDSFGSDSAYQIEIVFDWLVENEWNIDQIIPDLKTFRIVHSSLFTDQVNAMILKTAKAIADSFAGKNKSEHVLISQLNAVLEKQY